MIPLVDVHCHLLAGLDDGPRTAEDAVEMCRMAWAEGTRVVAATAHLGQRWPRATPDRIRTATEQLVAELKEIDLAMTVYPSAEVDVRPEMEELWRRGELLGVADRNAYLLIELPMDVFVDLRDTVRRFAELGIRPILAHPERYAEMLHQHGRLEELVRTGCLVQVSSDNVTAPRCPEDARALKHWFRRGLVHLVGSDGHSPRSRPPRMAEAYRTIAGWVGSDVADRLCGFNGLAVLEGRPLRVPKPKPPKRGWFSRFR
ncbi:MAG TPA: CpsB/CapC family capsule biosynthesis tyrosine phosphatase [Thermoguttaceae bacterium]|nr:CpsB/CapC family capsule biosynthesis tyrosine phosphatase [Thermoguttaceae bacterium]